LEESQGGQQAIVSTKTALEHGVSFDQENQSEGSDDRETASNNGGCVKIGDAAALAGISFDFSQSTITKARIASLDGFTHYFLKGYARPPSAESVPSPRENESVVPKDFFIAGLHMPPRPVLLDILCKF
jgi:hypothetical protein